MKVKYYIYRNLHKTGFFSIKFKGIVIDRQDVFVGIGADFRVSQSGRDRAIKTKQRNVHAYIAVDEYKIRKNIDVSGLVEVTYNPFLVDSFHIKTTGKPIFKADKVYFYKGKAFID